MNGSRIFWSIPKCGGWRRRWSGCCASRNWCAVRVSDEAVRLFYEFYAQTIVGGKWLCVVVKYGENDAFVVAAYLTDKPKAGEDLWPTK